MNILKTIAKKRQEDLREKGPLQGFPCPTRQREPFPLPENQFIIGEIKKASPSKGVFARDLNITSQAKLYLDSGFQAISVLTEQNFFHGSLQDMIAIRQAFPKALILRKDFLLTVADIEASHQAGADIILLIAALLTPEKLAELYHKAKNLGMTPLVEVHTKGEIDAIRPLSPMFVGINCRDLKTFAMDRLLPLTLAKHIDWPCKMVYESGIKAKETAHLAFGSGFHAILVGEGVIREKTLPQQLSAACNNTRTLPAFWSYIADKSHKPLVKICGLCREDDARLAGKLGADMLGFVFAPSPRQAGVELLQKIKDMPQLKVAVVQYNAETPKFISRLYEQGLIHAVQFHGNETPTQCTETGVPYYKALRPQTKDKCQEIKNYHCPRILIDAHNPHQAGGTGQRVSSEICKKAAKQMPLWLAGGIGPDNIKEIITTIKPELVDCSSKLETKPGQKDHAKIEQLFYEIKHA